MSYDYMQCIRCGAAYDANGRCSKHAEGCQGGAGEWPGPHASWCDGNGSIECWDCGCEGDYHDCGDDCCPHLNQEFETDCDTCDGTGRIMCPACERVSRADSDRQCDLYDASSY